jgi:hypothetical protein
MCGPLGQPVAAVRDALLDARRHGLSFDVAWGMAMGGRHGPWRGGPWRDALASTRDGWARAYTRTEPTGADLALIAVGTSHSGHRCDRRPAPLRLLRFAVRGRE